MPEKIDPQDVPVLVIGFNRSETLIQLWEALSVARPRTIYFACDAARQTKPDEARKVAEVRETISLITWPCKINTLFQTQNQGCGKGPYLAMDWFFQNVEYGIILEDDCIPHPDFFTYCAELLARYNDDSRVMTISGDASPLRDLLDFHSFSYGFSRFSLTWGWASWRRAWRSFNFALESWPLIKETGWLRGLVCDEDAYNGLHDAFEGVYTGRHSSVWDYQWTYNCLVNSGLSIIPAVNLISNVGFGNDATHTRDSHSQRANFPVKALRFPMNHPPHVHPWIELDHAVLFRAIGVQRKSWIRKLIKKIMGLPHDRKHYAKVR